MVTLKTGRLVSTVLVTDDNPLIRETLREILQIEHQVLEAENGEIAIDILTVCTVKVDLLLLDLNMPVTNGWETLSIIRDTCNGWPNLKVVMLTVHGEAENCLKAWMYGVSYFITKPFHAPNILEYVNLALLESVPVY